MKARNLTAEELNVYMEKKEYTIKDLAYILGITEQMAYQYRSRKGMPFERALRLACADYDDAKLIENILYTVYDKEYDIKLKKRSPRCIEP